jgi:predicted translin family RNA/ssDNA-binding protein
MNIKKALKEKNRLVKEILDLHTRVATYNSVEVGNVRPYSAKESMEKINQLSNELVELKTNIHRANAPIYHHIFRLSELKSTIARIKNLDCNEGIVQDYYSRNRETPAVKETEISIVERDDMVKHMEKQIEEIQDILDNHNQITVI